MPRIDSLFIITTFGDVATILVMSLYNKTFEYMISSTDKWSLNKLKGLFPLPKLIWSPVLSN